MNNDAGGHQDTTPTESALGMFKDSWAATQGSYVCLHPNDTEPRHTCAEIRDLRLQMEILSTRVESLEDDLLSLKLRMRDESHFEHVFFLPDASDVGVTSPTSETPISPATKLPPDEMEGVLCVFCNGVFKSKESLSKHKSRIHRKPRHERKFFTCNICNADFTLAKDLRRHQESKHESSNSKDEMCIHCSKTFRRKDNLMRHMRYQHQTQPSQIEEKVER